MSPLSRVVEALRRAIAGDGPAVDAALREIQRSDALLRDRLDALRGDVAALQAQIAKGASEKTLHAVDRRVERLWDAAGRHYRVTAQALRHAKWREEHRVNERRVLARLERIAASDRPVLIGPWSGEVGFELLYWIPFVTWAVEQARIDPQRILVASRGGAAPWYSHLGGRYLDILTVVPLAEFLGQTADEKKKQRAMGPVDRALTRRLLASASMPRAHLLHPGLMYRLFNPFWKQQMTVQRVERFTTHRALAPSVVPALAARLPADYVAVRFYFSASFPDTPSNRAFVDATIRILAESTDVVLLNTAFAIDDHRDYAPAWQGRIHTVDDLMTPDRNLDVQTAVIAGSRGFVGTYGGYAYLAPLCGVGSLAFYSERDAFFAHHLELADRVFRRLRAGSLVALDVRDVDLIRSALAPRQGLAVNAGDRSR